MDDIKRIKKMKAKHLPTKKRKNLNPITEFLWDLTETGKIRAEGISEHCGIKFMTFRNALYKNKVSALVRARLRLGGVINDDLVSRYEDWCRENGERC